MGLGIADVSPKINHENKIMQNCYATP
jgi:hypothetical protein